MKINSLTKFFTVVLFLVVSGLASLGFGQFPPPVPESEQCKAGSELLKSFGDDINLCVRCLKSNYQSKGCPGYEDPEEKGSCKADFEAYRKSIGDSTKACSAIVAKPQRGQGRSYSLTEKKTCTEQIAKCRDLMEATNPRALPSESRSSGLLSVIEIAANQQRIASGDRDIQVPSEDIDNGINCIKPLSTTNAKAEREKLRAENDKLREKQEKQEEKLVEAQKKLNEKLIEIEKKKSELDRELKEKRREIDVKKREQQDDVLKEQIESRKRVQELQKQITAQDNRLKRLLFESQQAQLNETSQRINETCRDQLNIAKNCMIRSTREEIPSADPVCSQFPGGTVLNNKRGIKANAEATRKLKFLERTCFESRNIDIKSRAFKQQEDINALTLSKAELENNLRLEEESQQNQQSTTQSILAEADREIAELEADLQQQLLELEREATTLNQQNQVENDLIQRRLVENQKEIDKLLFEEKVGARSSITEAEDLLSTSNDLADSVYISCKCADNKNPSYCSNLDRSNPDKYPQKAKQKSKSKR